MFALTMQCHGRTADRHALASPVSNSLLHEKRPNV
jgi:hypothetical protein